MFSIKNKEWAQQIAQELSTDFSTHVHEWTHWETGNTQDLLPDTEAKKIQDGLGNTPVNLLTKSIGTAVAAKLMGEVPAQLNKAILCGIPLVDISSFPSEESETIKSWYKEALAVNRARRVLVFQNEHDPHGSAAEVEQFLAPINKSIAVKVKPRSDHEHPHAHEFRMFFKDTDR